MAIRLTRASSESISIAGFNANADFTIMAWVRLAVISADQTLFDLSPSPDLGVYFANTGDQFHLYDTGDVGDGVVRAAATWYHIAWRRSSTLHQLVVDGVQTASATATNPGTSRTLRVGIYSAGSNGFDGRIANLQVYAGVALTDAQIANEMRVIRLVYTTNLWAWLPTIEVGVANRVRDYSGNGRNFTETNTPSDEDGPPVSWGSPLALVQRPSQILFDAASNSGYKTASSSYNWAHVCTGSDRYLTVKVSMLSVASSSVTGITYNSVAMTFLGAVASVSGAVRVEIWGLIAPATGSNTIAVTLSAALDSAAGAESYTNVHQTSPTEGLNTATATNVGAADATVSVTSVADNCMIVDAVATDDTAITIGAGQTSRHNVTGALGSGAGSDEGPKTPAGAVTMNWTDVGALATWSIVGIALRPTTAASLGGTAKPALFYRYLRNRRVA